MSRSNYNSHLKRFAKQLRSDGTIGEAILWKELLSRKQFYGLHFNRQFPITNFIVDFICRKLKLVIEVDGESHQHNFKEDKRRDRKLHDLGYTVIRVSEKEVRYDLKNVIRILEWYLPEEILQSQSP